MNEKKNAVVEIEDEDGRLVIWCVKMKNTNVGCIHRLTIASESHKFPLNFLSSQKMCQAVKFLVLNFYCGKWNKKVSFMLHNFKALKRKLCCEIMTLYWKRNHTFCTILPTHF